MVMTRLLTDEQIKAMVTLYQMIEPFEDTVVSSYPDGKPCLSYGVDSYAYNARMAPYIKRIRTTQDAKASTVYEELALEGPYTLHPGEHVLTRTIEYFRIPETVFAFVTGKSTYARQGLLTNVTPLDPGWEGYVTVSLINPTNHSIVLYPHEGLIAVFFWNADRPYMTYADRKGKYMQSTGITEAR